jgi:hypothetical protein
MIRYVATASIVAVVFGFAAKARYAPSVRPSLEIVERLPRVDQVDVVPVPGGRKVRVRQSVTSTTIRALLVYERRGEMCTADKAVLCSRDLRDRSKVREEEEGTEVVLEGMVPDDATAVRVLLEDEAETRWLTVDS